MAQHIHSFPNDTVSYIVPTWSDLDAVCLDLAHKITADGRSFDRLVTLAKGGWPMSRTLLDYLRIPEVASIGIRFYAGIGQRLDEPLIYQDLPVTVKGERILLFDDVADSGESLVFTKEHLLAEGVESVTTATLYYKPKSVVKPDYYGDETSAWIIFPFEVRECLTELDEKWRGQHIEETEVRQRFTTMGFQPAVLDYYFALPKGANA